MAQMIRQKRCVQKVCVLRFGRQCYSRINSASMLLDSWQKNVISCGNISPCQSDAEKKALTLSEQYPADINGDDFAKGMQHLPSVHKANFVNAQIC